MLVSLTFTSEMDIHFPQFSACSVHFLLNPIITLSFFQLLLNFQQESDEEDVMDSMNDDDNSGDRNLPNAKILTSKTISEWCQLVAKDPKSPALLNLLNAFQDACQFGAHSDSLSMERLQNTRVFHQIITFVLSESDNIFRALLEVSDDLIKGKIMNLRDSKKRQAVDPLIKSYLQNSVDLLNQLTDNKMLTFVLTRLRASVVLFCAYPSTSTRLLKVLLSVANWMLLVASV
jgi:nucleolar complex protein 2